MAKNFMLSTIDNPFNPFTDFISWNLFDVENGYNTCSKLGRIVNLSDDLSQKEIDDETERAIDVIMRNDFLNIYELRSEDWTNQQ